MTISDAFNDAIDAIMELTEAEKQVVFQGVDLSFVKQTRDKPYQPFVLLICTPYAIRTRIGRAKTFAEAGELADEFAIDRVRQTIETIRDRLLEVAKTRRPEEDTALTCRVTSSFETVLYATDRFAEYIAACSEAAKTGMAPDWRTYPSFM